MRWDCYHHDDNPRAESAELTIPEWFRVMTLLIGYILNPRTRDMHCPLGILSRIRERKQCGK